MFDQLLDLVKGHSGKAIINNPEIPNEKNEEVIKEASGSILSSLQNMFSQGKANDVLKMFANHGTSTDAVKSSATSGVIQNLMDKFGFNNNQATNVANQVVPNVVDDLVKKTNDPADNGFDIQNIFNSISGGKTTNTNVGGLLSKIKSANFDLDGDGDTDLQDLLSIAKGGGKGLLDKVKGLFGQ